MPSVYVTHCGFCADPKIQDSVIRQLSDVARLADLLRPAQPRHRIYDDALINDAFAERGLFPDSAGEIFNERYIRIRNVRLNGLTFCVPHNRAYNPGEEHFGFVFATVGDLEQAQGVLVGVAEPSDRADRARPRLVHSIGAVSQLHATLPTDSLVLERACVKVRGEATDWVVKLLGHLRRYRLPALDYSGWHHLQGWKPEYDALDPSDAKTRDAVWHAIKVGLLNDFIAVGGAAPDVEDLIASGLFAPPSVLERFGPRNVVAHASPQVKALLGGDENTKTALAAAARRAIVSAGTSQFLWSLGFGFLGHELILSSNIHNHLKCGRWVPEFHVYVDLAPAGLTRRAIAAATRRRP